MRGSPGANVALRAALVAGAIAVFGSGLGSRDLWNPNEPLYGRAVVEMAASGDRLLPTVNGERFAEKPPLYYWLALGAARITGAVDETSLRVPSVLAALVAVGLLVSLVERAAGRRRAWIAAGVFATTYSVAWAARSIQMDILVAATTLGAVHAVRCPPRRAAWTAPVLAGLWVGLGVLAKGPVGIVCPALVLGADAIVSEETRRILRPRAIAIAALVALAVSVPWYVLVAIRCGAGSIDEVLWRQNFVRAVAPWDHEHSWWYYLGTFWIEAAPWAPFVLLAARPGGSGRASSALDRLAWVWLVAIVAFFSMSASKRGAYLLPAMPAVAILVSGTLDRVHRRAAGVWERRGAWAIAGGTALVLAASAAVAAIVAPIPASVRQPVLAVAAVQAAGLGAVGWAIARRRARPLGPAVALGATLVATWIVAGAWALPAANELKSARGFCAELGLRVPADAPLRSWGSWRWRASYVYYARREIPRLETDDELRAYFASADPVYLLVERGALADAERILGPTEPILSAEIGSNAVYLLTNRRATRPGVLPDGRTPPTAGGATVPGA